MSLKAFESMNIGRKVGNPPQNALIIFYFLQVSWFKNASVGLSKTLNLLILRPDLMISATPPQLASKSIKFLTELYLKTIQIRIQAHANDPPMLAHGHQRPHVYVKRRSWNPKRKPSPGIATAIRHGSSAPSELTRKLRVTTVHREVKRGGCGWGWFRGRGWGVQSAASCILFGSCMKWVEI